MYRMDYSTLMIGMEAFENCCGRWLIFPMFLSAWSCKATPKHRSLCSILGLELIRPWAASTLPKFKIDLIVVIFKKPPNRAFQLIQVLKIGPAWRRGWKNMKPKIHKEDATHGRWYWKDILIYIYTYIYILYYIDYNSHVLCNDKLEYATEVNCETNCSAKPKSHVFHPWPMSRPPRPHQRAPHSNDPTERPPAPSKGHHRAWDASKIVVARFSAGLLYRSSQWQPVSALMQKIIVEPPLSFNMQPILSGQLDTMVWHVKLPQWQCENCLVKKAWKINENLQAIANSFTGLCRGLSYRPFGHPRHRGKLMDSNRELGNLSLPMLRY